MKLSFNRQSTETIRPTTPSISAFWRSFWYALAGHFLLTCLFTFPLILNFGSKLPGQLIEDRDQNLWNLWWVRDSLLHLRNPFHTDFIYYPDGVSLYFHTLHPINGLLSAPVQLVFGMTAAYNFVVFFSFILAGVGAFLLCRYLTGNVTAAFAASLIFAYAPYHMGTLKGLMQLISLQWLPFYILFLLMASHDPRRRYLNIALAALFLVCTALTDWYYTLFLLGFTLLYIMWVTGVYLLEKARKQETRGESFWKGKLLPVAAIVLVFLVLISPVLLPMLRELNNTSYFLPDPNDTRKFSADFTAFFLPPTTSTFFGWTSQNFQANYVTGPLAAQVYLGYVALGLAGLGLIFRKGTRFWGFTALVFWLLSFGPALRVNGAQPGWPMPFAVLENLPVVKITRSPDRFIVITMLCLAVCAAFGIGWVAERLKPNRNWWAAGIAGVLISLEFLQISYPLNDFQVSPFFEQLGRDTADYALLELPPQGGFYTGSPRMAEQIVHHKRIFDGYISREYDHPFQRNTPGFKELVTLKWDADFITPAAGENITAGSTRRAWYDAFDYYRVRYIILRLPQNEKQKASADINAYRKAIASVAPGEAVYKDAQIEAYAVPALTSAPRPFVEIGDGWYEPEQTTGAPSPVPVYHRWAAGNANLNLLWKGPENTTANFSYTLLTLEGEKPARLLLDGATVWQGKASPTPQIIKVPLNLSPGKHRLDFIVEGSPTTPKALGMGNDPRRLLYLVMGVTLP